VKAFDKTGAVVLGISPDAPAAQKKFEQKHKLGVRLLSDGDHAVTSALGAWGEKKLYGRTFQGIIRSTFLIDPQGRIARVWRKVKVDGHAQDVLDAVKELAA